MVLLTGRTLRLPTAVADGSAIGTEPVLRDVLIFGRLNATGARGFAALELLTTTEVLVLRTAWHTISSCTAVLLHGHEPHEARATAWAAGSTVPQPQAPAPHRGCSWTSRGHSNDALTQNISAAF
jgi:hypothetical protein